MNTNHHFNATRNNSILNHPSYTVCFNIHTENKQAQHSILLTENNTE